MTTYVRGPPQLETPVFRPTSCFKCGLTATRSPAFPRVAGSSVELEVSCSVSRESPQKDAWRIRYAHPDHLPRPKSCHQRSPRCCPTLRSFRSYQSFPNRPSCQSCQSHPTHRSCLSYRCCLSRSSCRSNRFRHWSQTRHCSNRFPTHRCPTHRIRRPSRRCCFPTRCHRRRFRWSFHRTKSRFHLFHHFHRRDRHLDALRLHYCSCRCHFRGA